MPFYFHNRAGRIIASTATLSLLLVSCSSTGNYAKNCVLGAGVGALGGAIFEGVKQRGNVKQGNFNLGSSVTSLAIGAGAGCAVGLAATAIGEILDERERQRQDEVFQKAAQAGAEQAERERLQVEERYRNMPTPASDAERMGREQSKQRDIQVAQTKQGNPESWSEGSTKGQAIYIGPATSPKTGEVIKTADGKDCIKVKELVWKDGRQVSQESDACRGSDGHYTRIEQAKA